MLGGVFISYRREDSAGFAGRIYDRLSRRLDAKSVFLDVDNIQPGLDFVEVLAEKLRVCDALIAVIGKNWNSSADKDNRRRLDDPDDFVRIEIEAALRRGIRVIPVLVDGAAMPRREDLPDSLQKLRRRQAIEISHNRFDSDVERLTRALSLIEEELRQRESAEATQGEEVRHQQEAAEAERQEQKRQKAADAAHRQEEWRLAEAGAARPVRAQEPAAIGSSAMAQISHGAEPDRPPQAWNTPSRTDAQTSAQTRGWLAKVGNSLKTLQGAVVTFVALCTALLGLVTGGCNFPLFIHSCQIVGLIGGKPEAPETVRPRSAEDTAAGAGFFHSPRGGHEDQANLAEKAKPTSDVPGASPPPEATSASKAIPPDAASNAAAAALNAAASNPASDEPAIGSVAGGTAKVGKANVMLDAATSPANVCSISGRWDCINCVNNEAEAYETSVGGRNRVIEMRQNGVKIQGTFDVDQNTIVFPDFPYGGRYIKVRGTVTGDCKSVSWSPVPWIWNRPRN